MGCPDASDGVDGAVAELAGRQYGVVSREQLISLGVSPRQIQRRVAAARLLPLHRCVFAVGHRSPGSEARWMAAVLACGAEAVLSHRSAAALWQFIDRERELPEVTARSHRQTRGVTTHRGRLMDADRAICAGIPVTSPARTLADIAHLLAPGDLERAVREAQFRRLFHLPSVLAVLDRRPSRRLRALVNDMDPTQSRLEDRLLRICRRHRLPTPITQRQIGSHRVDFLWPAHRVVVETDGYEAHATLSAFQRDRTALNDLQLAGYTVLRFTYTDLARRPACVAGQIARALAS